ncbi:hypothetical protein F5Y17DRAFT_476633 [Xylariaceae sp. FL0594]|nr:hypothetical protein F5Y17DRAFT_476633 [Xylariaceae sp. FL0594]
MCQLIRRRYQCEHPSGASQWIPSTADECGDAVRAGAYGVDGRLQRCRGHNSSTTTLYDHGHCDNSSCRKKAFKKCGWYCHNYRPRKDRLEITPPPRLMTMYCSTHQCTEPVLRL